MEEKAVQAFDGAFYVKIVDRVVAAFVVGGVADYGVIYRREVDADLVGAAGFDLDFEQRKFFKPLTDTPVGQCVAAVGGDGHFCAVPAVAGHRAVDDTGWHAGAGNEGDIFLPLLGRKRF